MKKKIKPAEKSVNMQHVSAIDGKECEAAFIRSGRDPGHLARFLKKYPAAFYLSWVKTAIAGWGASGDYDNLELLRLHKVSGGQRKYDSGLNQVYTDFLIYRAVMQMIGQGYKLTANREGGGIFHALQDTEFNGKYLSKSQIKSRYYRFYKYEPATFIDDDETMISGPARIQISGFDCVGFWIYTPGGGFKTLAK